ncbi:MAG: hypothetical protein HY763_01965, partial [Planctomycetes bacterium]|nr:hypothetical protein [Planctomycetota bacterium]
ATASTILTLNAANVTGNFSTQVDDIATGANITLGGGNDTFTIGTGSTGTSTFVSLGSGNDTFTGDSDTDSADTVSAGDGTDTIQAGDGNDTITTGAGSDTVIYDQTAANDREDVTDFTAGTGGDVMKFDQSDLSLNGVTEGVGAIAGLGAAFINIQTGAGNATDAAAEAAFNAVSAHGDGVEYILVYFNTTDSTTHIIYDADVDTDGGAVLLGRLTNITTQATHDQLTAANIDSQP